MQVTVVRDARRAEIDASELLVGDVMLVDTGDILPTDGILFEGNNMRWAPLYSVGVPHTA